MTALGAAKARRVLAALIRIGWSVKRASGSHKTLARDNWPDFVFAFHDDEEVGPKMGPYRQADWFDARRPVVRDASRPRRRPRDCGPFVAAG